MLALDTCNCGRYLSGHEGSDVCVGDAAGCSESDCVGREVPLADTQGVGSFVDGWLWIGKQPSFC